MNAQVLLVRSVVLNLALGAVLLRPKPDAPAKKP